MTGPKDAVCAVKAIGLALALLFAGSAANAANGIYAANKKDAAALRAYCGVKFPGKPGVCDCLDMQFGKLLTLAEQAYLGAVLRKEKSAIPDLRGALSPDQITATDGFLPRQTLLCQPSG